MRSYIDSSFRRIDGGSGISGVLLRDVCPHTNPPPERGRDFLMDRISNERWLFPGLLAGGVSA